MLNRSNEQELKKRKFNIGKAVGTEQNLETKWLGSDLRLSAY